MTTEHKPHSELVAAIETGIRSTGDTKLGGAARYQARAALRSLEEQLEAAQNALKEIADYECEPFDDDVIEAHVSAAYNDLAKIAREALNPASVPKA